MAEFFPLSGPQSFLFKLLVLSTPHRDASANALFFPSAPENTTFTLIVPFWIVATYEQNSYIATDGDAQ